jgi:hypothetical protein
MVAPTTAIWAISGAFSPSRAAGPTVTASPAKPRITPIALRAGSGSTPAPRAISADQNGVIPLITAASPAPISIWP